MWHVFLSPNVFRNGKVPAYSIAFAFAFAIAAIGAWSNPLGAFAFTFGHMKAFPIFVAFAYTYMEF